MRIEYTRVKPFSDIYPGDIFGHGDTVYMKTKPFGGNDWAVCLEDGDLADFSDDAMVEPLDGKVVLE